MPFDDIYLEYYQRCFLFAKSYLQDEMLSKDIASEAMITLWTTMKTGELPEKTRKAFMMSRYQNKSVKEIAGLLDVTVKGADYHIGKALQALRKSLKDYLSSFLFF